MAIYVPGVPQYFPEFKPFTPDYKFLSSLLEARQTKYNTNYKALNDQYNKVVYGDLTRQDTQEAREQFVNKLGPQLEKISGMDLSLAENVNAAKGVFAPFYQEDIIVKDLVVTGAAKSEQKKAEFFRTASDENTRSNYWDTGVKKMQYDLMRFQNASRDEALAMQNPKYIANPNLYKRGMKYLQDQGYKVTKEYSPQKGNFFRVVNENGDEITETALNDLTSALTQDPAIIDGYYAQAYVDSMDSAMKAVQENRVGSIDEGVKLWSLENLQEVTIGLSERISDQTTQLSMLETSVNKWQKQIDAGQSPIPGSQDYLTMVADMRMYGAISQKQERDSETLARIQTSFADYERTGDISTLSNQASQFLMTANMREDFIRTARNFTNINKSTKYLVNEEEKQRRSFENQWLLQNAKNNKGKDQAGTASPTRSLSYSFQLNEEEGILEYKETAEDDVVSMNNVVNKKAYDNNSIKMANYIAESLTENGTVSRKTIFDLGIVVSDNAGNNVKVSTVRDSLIQMAQYEPEKFMGLWSSEEVSKFNVGEYKLIIDEFNTLKNVENSRNKAYIDNLSNLTLIDDKYKKLVEGGAILPLVDDENGNPVFLTEEQYDKIVLEKIENGELSGEAFKLAASKSKKRTPVANVVSVNGQVQDGYDLTRRDFFLVPSRSQLIKGDDGHYYYTSDSFIPKDKGAEKILHKDIMATGKYEFSEKGLSPLQDKYILKEDVRDVNGNIIEPAGTEHTMRYLIDQLNNQNDNKFAQQYAKDLTKENIFGQEFFNPEQFRPSNSFNFTTVGTQVNDPIFETSSIYQKHMEALNTTLSGNLGFDQKSKDGKPVLFQQFYQHSAFTGDSPGNNLITTTSASITGEKSYKKDPISKQMIAAMKNQLDNVKSNIVSLTLNGVKAEGLTPEVLNAFSETADQKNVVMTYIPAINIGGDIKAQYIITKFNTEGEEEQKYEMTFDQELDDSPASLKNYQVLNPVMLKINEGNPTNEITIPGKDFGFATDINAGSITARQSLSGEIFIDLVPNFIKDNGDLAQNEKISYGPYAADNFMLYNNKYNELVKLLYISAKDLGKKKKEITKAENNK